MAQQIDALQAQVYAQRLDVVDEAIAAVRRGVVGYRGVARPPQVEQHQLPVGGESAQVAEVDGGLHRPAGHTDQWLALALEVVGELGPVIRVKEGHARHPNRHRAGLHRCSV